MNKYLRRQAARVPAAVPLLAMYLALAFAVLGANPFKGETLTPFDVLMKQPAWSWIEPGIQPRQTERTDILNGLLPYWTNARAQLRSGRAPMWNDDAAGGTTLLVASYSMLTPGFVVFATAPNPAMGFHFAIVLNLALAGLGMHLFLRRRLGWAAAAVGAATFMFCGFHAAWLYWPHVFTSIWAPWLLLAIDRCPGNPRARDCLAIAAATALVILGGFPFVSEMVLISGGLYFIVLWIHRLRTTGDWSRFALCYVAGCVLGIFACSLLLMEFVAWLQQFDLGYRTNRGSYLDIAHATRLLPPWAYEYKRVEQTMYVGAVMLVFAMIAVITNIIQFRKPNLLVLFSLLLFIVSAGLVFGLWPMWLVAWIPGMAFNSWSRAISVMDLSLVILGACGLDWMLKLSSRQSAKALRAGVLLVAIAQVCEISFFFNRYNGAVPGHYYYPEIPATRYLQENAGPFDYVIADRSFNMSGELGAYGLREWFAHQFRTPAQKAILDQMVRKHFLSRTASRFKAEQIQTASSVMNDFNVRYLAISSQDPHARGPGTREWASREPLPPQPGHDWKQQFQVTGSDLLLQGISVRLATYQRKDLAGNVSLVLQGGQGQVLVESVIDAGTVVDNQMTEFYFNQPIDAPVGNYAFSLHYRPSDAQAHPLTAWVAPLNVPTSRLLVNGQVRPGVMEYVLHPGNGVSGNFRRIQTAAGVSIFENMNSPNGPYFLRTLEETADRHSSEKVRVRAYAPDMFTLEYTGSAAGYIVVPMSMASGWKATINDRPVQIELKRNVMPAVPVPGPGAVQFEYAPSASRWFLPWLAVLFAVLALAFHIDRKSAAQRKDGLARH